jgi:hypothetical protein
MDNIKLIQLFMGYFAFIEKMMNFPISAMLPTRISLGLLLSYITEELDLDVSEIGSIEDALNVYMPVQKEFIAPETDKLLADKNAFDLLALAISGKMPREMFDALTKPDEDIEASLQESKKEMFDFVDELLKGNSDEKQ